MVCSVCFHARNWDADAVRDDLRDYVIDAFGDLDAALFVDGPADAKKGSDAVGVTSRIIVDLRSHVPPHGSPRRSTRQLAR